MKRRRKPKAAAVKKTPAISLCMIVKNELQNLKKNFLPLVPVFAEMVIVDTGSNDGTEEFLQALPKKVKVINFPWTDSFAEARNQYLKASTAEWIFWLDADDRMNPNDVVVLNKCARMGPIYYWCHHILKKKEFFQIRLFPNLPGVQYVYRCHEQVYQSLDHLGITRRFFPKSFIAIKPPRPSSRPRNIRLLKMDVSENPDHLMAYNWLASEYLASGEYDRGLSFISDLFSRRRKWETPEQMYIQQYAFRLIRDSLLKAAQEGKAVNDNLLKGLLKDDTFSAIVHNDLGTIYRTKGMLDEAISEYKKALEINPYLADVHYNVGLIFLDKDLLDEAIFEFKNALTVNPRDADAYMAMGLAYSRKGALDEAISKYKKVLTINPNHGGGHNNLAIAYFRKKDYELASRHCDKAIQAGFEVHPEFIEALKRFQ